MSDERWVEETWTQPPTSFYERKILEVHVEIGLQAVERSQSNAGPAYSTNESQRFIGVGVN